MDIKVLVATHKPYRMPEDEMYLPLHVGREGKADLGFAGDNTGDNISAKNANYCELTGLYWAWKNLSADAVGLAHYRRHFVGAGRGSDRFDRVLTKPEAEALLAQADVLVPNPRRYYIETTYDQYVHAHHREGLDCVHDILRARYPAYLPAWDAVMRRTWGHRFNMFIMKRPQFDAYCQWLFDILFEVEATIDISEYSPSEARVFGYLSERMLDVWLETNQVRAKEVKVQFMEKQNWLKKGGNFLLRKLRGGRREEA